MKTMEAFIREIGGSVTLQDELRAINDRDALAAFLKRHDVSGTIEDFETALKAKSEAEGEISDDAVEAASGGSLLLRLHPEILECVKQWRSSETE